MICTVELVNISDIRHLSDIVSMPTVSQSIDTKFCVFCFGKKRETIHATNFEKRKSKTKHKNPRNYKIIRILHCITYEDSERVKPSTKAHENYKIIRILHCVTYKDHVSRTKFRCKPLLLLLFSLLHADKLRHPHLNLECCSKNGPVS